MKASLNRSDNQVDTLYWWITLMVWVAGKNVGKLEHFLDELDGLVVAIKKV